MVCVWALDWDLSICCVCLCNARLFGLTQLLPSRQLNVEEAATWRERAAAAGRSRAVMHGMRCGFTAQRCWAVLSPEQSSGESPWQADRGWFVGEISLAERVCKGWVPTGETPRVITLGKRADGVSWLSSCSSACLHHPCKPHVVGESTFSARFAEGMEGQKG